MEGVQRGRVDAQTEQEWEEFLAFGLELVSAQAWWSFTPTRISLNKEMEGPSPRQSERSTIHQQHPEVGRQIQTH